MPRLRAHQEKPDAERKIEMAIAMETFRPGAIAPLVTKGQQLPIDHPTVVAFPESFRG